MSKVPDTGGIMKHKPRIVFIIPALIFLCFFVSPFLFAAESVEKILNVYNWANAMPEEIIREFEKETGIRVNYTTYGSNEALYAKLKANPNIAYDIVVPSTYFVQRMRKGGMIQKIDKTKLSNFKNLDTQFLNQDYDPNNDYSIPYLWGATGIVFNDKFHNKNDVKSWRAFWDPKYRNQLLVLDDARDVFSIALLSLGYSPNETDPAKITEAFEKAKKLLPNIKFFNSESQQAMYVSGESTLGMGWNGIVFLGQKSNPHLQFVYPEEGFVISLDSMTIPRGAKHVDNALKFIDFILRPEIAERISVGTGFSSANREGMKRLPPELRNNQSVNPDKATYKRGHFQSDVGDAATLYEKYYDQLKLGN